MKSIQKITPAIFNKLKTIAVCSVVILMLSQSAQSQPVTYTGFVDAYYSYNFATPMSLTNKLRNFDTPENLFTLSLAELVIQKTASPVGFRLDLDYGATNDVVQQASTSTLSIVQQAYVTAVLPVGAGLTVDVGKFVTHMGYEVIESKDNANYSRSFLFAYAIPYYHTGMRLSYPIASSLTACIHIVNGWNSSLHPNDSKSIGATLNYTASSTTGIIFNGMWGHENLIPVEIGARNVYDLCVNQTVSDNFTLGLNGDYGEAGTSAGLATWKGAALYGKYSIDTLSAIAVRAEVYNDPVGYTIGTPGTYKEVTLTLEHKLFNQMLTRAELRNDMAGTPFFDNSTKANVDKNQLTFLVGLVVTF
ncbi:MAG: porin [Bacteroidota bacterium]|jgi:hypothetical protein